MTVVIERLPVAVEVELPEWMAASKFDGCYPDAGDVRVGDYMIECVGAVPSWLRVSKVEQVGGMAAITYGRGDGGTLTVDAGQQVHILRRADAVALHARRHDLAVAR